jgi:hypothetical protein
MDAFNRVLCLLTKFGFVLSGMLIPGRNWNRHPPIVYGQRVNRRISIFNEGRLHGHT